MNNAPKPSIKYLKDKICKIKQTQNIPVTLGTFLNQSKKKPQNRKLNSKEESLELPYLNFSAKFLTEKKTNLKKQYNFCKDVISSEFRDMSQPAKLLRSENFKATIQPLSD